MRTSEDFGTQGESAVASGAARLAGRRIRGSRLEHEADAPADRHVGDLPAVVADADGTRVARSREPSAGAAVALAASGGTGSRCGAGGVGPAESRNRRPERPAAAARRRGRTRLCQQREVGGEQGRGPLPPRAVHPLPAHHAVSAAEQFRRARFGGHLLAAAAVEYPAAVAEPAERSGVLRGGAGAGGAGDATRRRATSRTSWITLSSCAWAGRRPRANANGSRTISIPRRRRFAPTAKAAAAMQPVDVGVSADRSAAWVAVSRVLLNLDEFITRE